MEAKKQSRKVGVAGGLINQLMGNNSSVPVVGEGATILQYSDRSAYEVISVADDKNSCVIRKVNAKFIGKCYGDERYEYESDESLHTLKLEWNEKKKSWGSVYTNTQIQKSLLDKLYAQHGRDWAKNLPVSYESLIVEGDEKEFNPRLKLVKGITKEYKTFSKVSVIFGRMDEYRDPSF